MSFRTMLVCFLVVLVSAGLVRGYGLVTPGHFALVYVYEANTHTGGISSFDPPSMVGLPPTHVSGDVLYVDRMPKIGPFTSIAVIRETSEAGFSVQTELKTGVLPLGWFAIGEAGSRHRLLDGRLMLKRAGRDGSIELRYAGARRVLAAGETWSAATCDREGLQHVFESPSEQYYDVVDASSEGARASRLMVFNHGLWEKSRVSVVGS